MRPRLDSDAARSQQFLEPLTRAFRRLVEVDLESETAPWLQVRDAPCQRHFVARNRRDKREAHAARELRRGRNEATSLTQVGQPHRRMRERTLRPAGDQDGPPLVLPSFRLSLCHASFFGTHGEPQQWSFARIIAGISR